MKKRGQFYLIAAIMVVGFVIGFATISNSLRKNDFTKVNDLAEQLKIESENVLDYDLYNPKGQLDNFTKQFSEYAGDDIKIIYVINQSGKLNVYNYTEGKRENVVYNLEGNEIKINVDEKNYTIELEKENNFHFIMYQKLRGEKYVITD